MLEVRAEDAEDALDTLAPDVLIRRLRALPGFTPDASWAPLVVLPRRAAGLKVRPLRWLDPDRWRKLDVRSVLVRGTASRRFLRSLPSGILAWYPDLKIVRSLRCQSDPLLGTTLDVMGALSVSLLHEDGADGRGVHVAVLDEGIPFERFPEVVFATSSTSPDGGTTGLNSASGGNHAAISTALVTAIAPAATVIDVPILGGHGSLDAFSSDAAAALAEILGQVEDGGIPRPLVLVNPWEVIGGGGLGDLERFGHQDSPLCVIAEDADELGVDTVVAAGNCGQCPGQASLLDPSDKPILGFASHPSVLTVGAIDLDDEVLGYSSHGPGRLSQFKPDLVTFSHFFESRVQLAAGGTSAATALAGGVLAAVRSKAPRALSAGDLRTRSRQTASDPTWTPGRGFGGLLPYGLLAEVAP